jgi:hypothetical protein
MIVGVAVKHLFKRDLAVQFFIERHEHGAQAALGMGPQHAEALSVARGRAHGVGRGDVGITSIGRPVYQSDMAE